MCLAVPAKIVAMDDKMATVEIGGSRREASMVLLPDAVKGDYVLLHAGFAISLIDEAEALETLRLFRSMLPGDEEPADD
ncbi:MAG: HypC/HybG/HupF family hydrogenase formation chaperone [Thermoleophilia bacterium]